MKSYYLQFDFEFLFSVHSASISASMDCYADRLNGADNTTMFFFFLGTVYDRKS